MGCAADSASFAAAAAAARRRTITLVKATHSSTPMPKLPPTTAMPIASRLTIHASRVSAVIGELGGRLGLGGGLGGGGGADGRGIDGGGVDGGGGDGGGGEGRMSTDDGALYRVIEVVVVVDA